MTTNKQAFIVLGILFLIFAEALFLGNGNAFFVILGLLLLYYGAKDQSSYRKYYIGLGIFFLAISILSMFTLRLLVFAALAYLLYRLWKGESWEQIVDFNNPLDKDLIQNKFFGVQSTPFEAYEWKDIHVQGIAGDILIDATQTVLPKRTSLLSIRQGFGKVRVILPYEVPVRIHYTTLYGNGTFFSKPTGSIWNGKVELSDGYEMDTAPKTEMIITIATWVGDVEVIRR
nr:cell wall-active antibiotics response protein LiaF [Planomicrobium sp. YIM 101495]